MPVTQEFIESLLKQNQMLLEKNNTLIEQVDSLSKTIDELNATITLNYSCTSGTASANGCALSDINITDTLQRFPPKKGALLPWVIVFL